jgi:hypothetical protein
MAAPDSTTAVLELLDRERAALLACVDRVPAPLRVRRPTPERWSVMEVLEHLARVERGVAKLLAIRGQEQAPAAVALDDAQLDAARIARLRSRSERIEAPSRIQPEGALGPAETMQALADSRSALRAALQAAHPAALDGVTHTHPILGVLTLRGWACFVAHHEARHAAQVEEIAEALAT